MVLLQLHYQLLELLACLDSGSGLMGASLLLPAPQITEEVKGVLSTVGNGAQDLYNNVRTTAGSMWGGANPSVPNFQFS